MLLASLLCLVTASVSCGPDGQASWSKGRQVNQRNQTPGPLAGAMPPFSTNDQGPNPPASGQGEASGVDARVQSFVGRFPPDDRDRQARTAPSQSPDPTGKSGTQASTAKPPTGTKAPGMAAATAKGAQRSGPPELLANRPAVTAMQPVDASTIPTLNAPTQGGTDTQGSPQPPPINLGPAPLPEPTKPHVELIDVRPASSPTTMPSGTESGSSANQPVLHPAMPRGGDLGGMLAELEAAVKAHPEQLDNQFKLRLLYLATDQDDKAAGPIAAGDPVQAHLATALFGLLTSAKSAIRQPTTSPAPALLAAEELHRLLGQQAPVVIPKIALVTRVNSFGDYEAVNPARFSAGQGVHVFLYTEVSNFRSEPTPDGRLRTLLAEKVEIFDSTGKVIWKQSADNIEDKVLSPRRDFFVPLEVRLPAGTPAGEYVLKATIEDKLGATTDQQRMTFVVE